MDTMIADIGHFRQQIRSKRVLHTERPALGIRILLLRGKEREVLSVKSGQACRRTAGLQDASGKRIIHRRSRYQEVAWHNERRGLAETLLGQGRRTRIAADRIQIGHREWLDEQREPAAYRGCDPEFVRTP